MPLEGHWERQTTPLRRLSPRERVVVIAATVLTLAAVAVLIAAFAGKDQAPPGPGCIRADIAHVMGAEQLNLCGTRARRACANAAGNPDPNAGKIRAACREAGLTPERR